MKSFVKYLNEISKGLAKRYLHKADQDLHYGRGAGEAQRHWTHAETDEEGERHRKRNKGIGLVRSKLGSSTEKKAKVPVRESAPNYLPRPMGTSNKLRDGRHEMAMQGRRDLDAKKKPKPKKDK